MTKNDKNYKNKPYKAARCYPAQQLFFHRVGAGFCPVRARKLVHKPPPGPSPFARGRPFVRMAVGAEFRDVFPLIGRPAKVHVIGIGRVVVVASQAGELVFLAFKSP